MNDLMTLPNIGKELAKKLAQAGVKTAEQLRSIGSEQSFIRIMAYDPKACLSMLSALEGAVQGIRWHCISAERKKELKYFYDQLSADK
jgi:DNA transformation protein and related proteins